MKLKTILASIVMLAAAAASAQEPIRIGVIAEMTGTQAEYGLQITNGMKLFMQENGDTVAGRKIELIIRDVGGPNPDVARRLAQELVSREKVDFLAGFGFTPNAMAAAPIATQSKTPMVVMNAASAVIPERSPYIVRTSMTVVQNAVGIADWAAKNGIKTAYILYADYAPGKEGAEGFKKTFIAAGGQIIGEQGAPLKNPDFSPYIQRIKDAKPDAAFIWFPSGELATGVLKSYRERGLDKANIKILGTLDAVDDMFINATGDAAVGLVTGGHYSFAHDSAKNKSFIKAYQAQYGTTMRPNFMAVGGYDGMAAIYAVIKKLNGKIDGDKAMEAFKGLKLESPRGPISIDPATRDIVQTVYIRRVEKKGKEYYSTEFDKYTGK
ncbi:MAG: transporter substrate-binding protein [Herminiimonas sp.]|nr:transporter substrate-binding protein [Herminiimonas sp.]